MDIEVPETWRVLLRSGVGASVFSLVRVEMVVDVATRAVAEVVPGERASCLCE